MIWHLEGLFSQSHEYGHGLHHQALGGVDRGGSCPSPHYLNGAHNIGCAWREGFASFHAAVVAPELSDFAEDLEVNKFYPADTVTTPRTSRATVPPSKVRSPPSILPTHRDDPVEYETIVEEDRWQPIGPFPHGVRVNDSSHVLLVAWDAEAEVHGILFLRPVDTRYWEM